MVVSGMSIWWVLAWAVFATIFYRIRYNKLTIFHNPWTMVGIFVVNLMFFGWAALFFVITEWVRWHSRKKLRQHGNK